MRNTDVTRPLQNQNQNKITRTNERTRTRTHEHACTHAQDTNTKFIDMYVAVAQAIADVVPAAKLGPANFAADGPSRAASWGSVIVPIVKGIIAAGAKVDYMAMSSYGRAIMCREPGVPGPDTMVAVRSTFHFPFFSQLSSYLFLGGDATDAS